MYPNFDFYNVESVLPKEAKKAGYRLPQLGDLRRLRGIQSKYGAAQFATAGSSRFEVWHDALALRFDHCGGALRSVVTVEQRRPDFGLSQGILKATRGEGHPNGVGPGESGFAIR
ncbi:MAG TPA: hypothetical protein VH278_05995 [Burkholderiaceae bacterium]|nr:hypothetical protein [Burkholderiaceae bacterium]